jgi:hypothetical protein
MRMLFLQGDFFDFSFYVQYSTLLLSAVSEDAWIEYRTVATTALAVRRSNHSAKSHPHENAGLVF